MAWLAEQMHPLPRVRSFRRFAAAISCQVFSTAEHVVSNLSSTEEVSCAIASPSMHIRSCNKPACVGRYDDTNRDCQSVRRSSKRRFSPLPNSSMSASVIDGRFSPCRLVQFRGSIHLARHYTTGSFGQAGCSSETYDSRLHVQELSSVRIWQISLRSHGGHAGHDHTGPDKSGKDGERVLGWGLWGDVGLAIGKGGAGYISGSTALIADAAHSVSDIALSGVALWTSKVAHVPKDKQHPYGHGKFETVGALGISGMLLLTGGGIAWHAVDTLQPFIPMMSDFAQTTTGQVHEHVHGDGHHHGIDLQHPYVALLATVVSIGVKERLYWKTKQVGEQQQSELLKASAWHHRSDAVSSIVALIGVGGAMLGLPLLDPLAGILVSGMIVKAGLETGYHSLQDLVDSGVQESVLSPIRATVLDVQGVQGCHHLRGRRMGSFIHVDAHIEVDPWLSVTAAHNIGETVRRQLQTQHPEVAETFVHIEPADRGTKLLTHNEAEIEHDHHDCSAGTHAHRHGSDTNLTEQFFTRKGLTKDVPKAYLMSTTMSDQECATDSFENALRQHPDVEQDVRHVVGAKFHEKMSISHVTSHFLQGKVVVEVEVSMNSDMSVRNAMDYASDAEQAILELVSDIFAVRVQLKLNKGLAQRM